MAESADEDILQRIVRLIEILKYDGMETLELNWVRSVLVKAGNDRQKFMVWVVSQLCPSDAEDLHLAPKQTHSQRILQSMSSLGLCRPVDMELIEGTAPPLNQLKFWRTCLEKISQLNHFSSLDDSLPTKSATDDMLLDQLSHSSYLSQILKDSGANVIPGDLRKMYKTNYEHIRSIPLPEFLQECEEKLGKLQIQYNSVDKKWKDVPLDFGEAREENEHQNICKEISALNKQRDLFQGVYSSYIAPWTTSASQLELPNTGPLVHQATTKLLELTKALKLMQDVAQKCEDLAEQDRDITKQMNHPSTIMSILQSIVTQESNTKPSGVINM